MDRLPARPALQYETVVPRYIDFVRQHRGRRTTQQLANALGRFLRWLSTAHPEIVGPHDLTPALLRDYLASFHPLRRATIAVHASALRGWLGYLRLQGLVEIDLAPAIVLPRVAHRSAPPRVFDRATVERLLGAVDRCTPLGKRDYAMLLLAARYGLRSSDIRTLRLDDIRWREQRIVLIQSKTQQPLELPLLPEVDEALVDYLQHGRPLCPAREIFLRHMKPIAPFSYGNAHWAVIARALRAAGIADPHPRRGFHRLRHSLATQLVADGVGVDVISDVLGHSSVDTTRGYTQVDLAGLRSVALTEAEVRR
jgi:integrase